MSYTVVPDVTASDLNIDSGSNDKHNLAITPVSYTHLDVYKRQAIDTA